MSVYGQSQVANLMARPTSRLQVGPMAGMGGSYTPARAAAEHQLAPQPGGMPNPSPQPLPQNAVVSAPAARYGLGSSYARYQGGGNPAVQRQNYAYTGQQGDGTAAGAQAPNAVQGGDDNSLQAIQDEMKRRQVGVQLNQDPNNSAMAGYMMGQ